MNLLIEKMSYDQIKKLISYLNEIKIQRAKKEVIKCPECGNIQKIGDTIVNVCYYTTYECGVGDVSYPDDTRHKFTCNNCSAKVEVTKKNKENFETLSKYRYYSLELIF